MAFVSTLTDFGVMGNLKYEIYTLTDCVDDSTNEVTSRMKTPLMAIPTANAVSGVDITVVSIAAKVVTLDTATTGTDGQLIILGK